MPSPRPLRVALLGLGTVARPVAAHLVDPGWRQALVERGITPPELVAVGVRDPERARGVTLPELVRRTDDLAALAGDPEVDVVVELIGGTEVAAFVVREAIEAGKAVVTANKALLAAQGAMLETAARASGARVRFEAAVGGGIPILGPLTTDLAANVIAAVRGIVNGTTNHVLSAMARDARSYPDVLAEAQRLGYAEADPTADVEGDDAVHKLAVLVRLAFGAWPDPRAIRKATVQTTGDAPPGITGVRSVDLSGAARLGLAIKLVARAQRDTEGIVRAAVTPMAVRATSPHGHQRRVQQPHRGGRRPGRSGLVPGAWRGWTRHGERGPGRPAGARAGPGIDLGRAHAGAARPTARRGRARRGAFVAVRDPPTRWSRMAWGSWSCRSWRGTDDAVVVRPMTLGGIRARLEALGVETTLYRVLAEA